MIPEQGAKHRPLTAKEFEDLAAELDRDGEPEPLRYVAQIGDMAKPPEVRTSVNRDGDGWTVQIEVVGGPAAHRLGRSVQTLDRGAGTARAVGQLDGFVPQHVTVRARPPVWSAARPEVHLRGPKGEYEPLRVFPGDGRHLLTGRGYPWHTIGIVETSDGFSGSGVLVGDRLMLTAQHVRPAKSMARGNWWMRFTPSFDAGRPTPAPFGHSYVSDAVWYAEDSDLEYFVGHDFMLCRLYQPLGRALGYLGSTAFDDGWRGENVWHNVGYPLDVGGGTRPAVQFDQSMEDDDEDDGAQILETEASLNHGNSGGPFFSWFTDGNIRLCGVVSGELTFGGDPDNALAGGDEMVGLIDWGRANWPA